ALDIHTFEIVPAVFGGDDSIPDEDEVRIFDLGFGRESWRARQIVFSREGHPLAADAERRRRLGRVTDERNVLRVTPVRVAGLEAQTFELLGQIVDGQFL